MTERRLFSSKSTHKNPNDQDEEFRACHEALISQQRYEAAMVRRRLEEEKVRIRQISDSGGGEMAYSDGMVHI